MLYETERLILRDWQDSDAWWFIALNQDPTAMEFYPKLYTREETISSIERFKKSLVENGYTMYACELKSNEQFIGAIGLLRRDFDLPCSPCVEIGWRLIPEYWGRGLAVEAAQKCLEIGFNEFSLSEIVSFTAAKNNRSQRVMQKLGMTHDVNGDFYHPRVDPGHWLAFHVLYRITKNSWLDLSCHA